MLPDSRNDVKLLETITVRFKGQSKPTGAVLPFCLTKRRVWIHKFGTIPGGSSSDLADTLVPAQSMIIAMAHGATGFAQLHDLLVHDTHSRPIE
jgi:hypothetical protein